MANENNKEPNRLQTIIPQDVAETAQSFVEFIKSYYEFINSADAASYNINSALINRDLRTASDQFIDKLYYELGYGYIVNRQANVENILSNLPEIYSAKGSLDSIRVLFRAMFGEEVSISLPKERILKPSSGNWLSQYSVMIETIQGDATSMTGKYVEVQTTFPGSPVQTFDVEVKSVQRRGEGVYEVFTSRYFTGFFYWDSIITYGDFQGKLVPIMASKLGGSSTNITYTASGGTLVPVIPSRLGEGIDEAGSKFRVGETFEVINYSRNNAYNDYLGIPTSYDRLVNQSSSPYRSIDTQNVDIDVRSDGTITEVINTTLHIPRLGRRTLHEPVVITNVIRGTKKTVTIAYQDGRERTFTETVDGGLTPNLNVNWDAIAEAMIDISDWSAFANDYVTIDKAISLLEFFQQPYATSLSVSASGDGTTLTYTTSSAHGLATRAKVSVSGMSDSDYDLSMQLVTVVSATTFTVSSDLSGSATGGTLNVMRGDLNSNGKVTLTDVILALKGYLGKSLEFTRQNYEDRIYTPWVEEYYGDPKYVFGTSFYLSLLKFYLNKTESLADITTEGAVGAHTYLNQTATGYSQKNGDINGDGVIDGTDFLIFLKYYLAQDATTAVNIATYRTDGNTLTVTTDVPHGLTTNMIATVRDTVPEIYNFANVPVTKVSDTEFTADITDLLNTPVGTQISEVATTGSSATYTTSSPHNIAVGHLVSVTGTFSDGVDTTSLDLTYVEVTATTSTTFTVDSTVTDDYLSGGFVSGIEVSSTGNVQGYPDFFVADSLTSEQISWITTNILNGYSLDEMLTAFSYSYNNTERNELHDFLMQFDVDYNSLELPITHVQYTSESARWYAGQWNYTGTIEYTTDGEHGLLTGDIVSVRGVAISSGLGNWDVSRKPILKTSATKFKVQVSGDYFEPGLNATVSGDVYNGYVRADITQDGLIDLEDVKLLLRKASGIPALPDPSRKYTQAGISGVSANAYYDTITYTTATPHNIYGNSSITIDDVKRKVDVIEYSANSSSITLTTSGDHYLTDSDQISFVSSEYPQLQFTDENVSTVPTSTTITIAASGLVDGSAIGKGIVSAEFVGNRIQLTTNSDHGLSKGNTISISGSLPSLFDVTNARVISVLNSRTFQIYNPSVETRLYESNQAYDITSISSDGLNLTFLLTNAIDLDDGWKVSTEGASFPYYNIIEGVATVTQSYSDGTVDEFTVPVPQVGISVIEAAPYSGGKIKYKTNRSLNLAPSYSYTASVAGSNFPRYNFTNTPITVLNDYEFTIDTEFIVTDASYDGTTYTFTTSSNHNLIDNELVSITDPTGPFSLTNVSVSVVDGTEFTVTLPTVVGTEITNAVASVSPEPPDQITYTTATAHGLATGQRVTVTGILSGVSESDLNCEDKLIEVLDSTTFKVAQASVDTYTSGGTVSAVTATDASSTITGAISNVDTTRTLTGATITKFQYPTDIPDDYGYISTIYTDYISGGTISSQGNVVDPTKNYITEHLDIYEVADEIPYDIIDEYTFVVGGINLGNFDEGKSFANSEIISGSVQVRSQQYVEPDTWITEVIVEPLLGSEYNPILQRDNGTGAIVRVTSTNANGGITDFAIDSFGYGYPDNFSTFVAPQNTQGTSATLSFKSSIIGVTNPTYVDRKGFLSDIIKLQDNNFYQEFSYVVETGVDFDIFEDVIKKSVHPAGMKVFGEQTIYESLQLSVSQDDSTSIYYNLFPKEYTFFGETESVPLFSELTGEISESAVNHIFKDFTDVNTSVGNTPKAEYGYAQSQKETLLIEKPKIDYSNIFEDKDYHFYKEIYWADHIAGSRQGIPEQSFADSEKETYDMLKDMQEGSPYEQIALTDDDTNYYVFGKSLTAEWNKNDIGNADENKDYYFDKQLTTGWNKNEIGNVFDDEDYHMFKEIYWADHIAGSRQGIPEQSFAYTEKETYTILKDMETGSPYEQIALGLDEKNNFKVDKLLTSEWNKDDISEVFEDKDYILDKLLTRQWGKEEIAKVIEDKDFQMFKEIYWADHIDGSRKGIPEQSFAQSLKETIEFSKTSSDSVPAADAKNKFEVDKALFDAGYGDDNNSIFDMSKILLDTPYSSDKITVAKGKLITERLLASEQAYVLSDKRRSENAYSNDQVYVTDINKPIEDIFEASNDVGVQRIYPYVQQGFFQTIYTFVKGDTTTETTN